MYRASESKSEVSLEGPPSLQEVQSSSDTVWQSSEIPLIPAVTLVLAALQFTLSAIACTMPRALLVHTSNTKAEFNMPIVHKQVKN